VTCDASAGRISGVSGLEHSAGRSSRARSGTAAGGLRERVADASPPSSSAAAPSRRVPSDVGPRRSGPRRLSAPKIRKASGPRSVLPNDAARGPFQSLGQLGGRLSGITKCAYVTSINILLKSTVDPTKYIDSSGLQLRNGAMDIKPAADRPPCSNTRSPKNTILDDIQQDTRQAVGAHCRSDTTRTESVLTSDIAGRSRPSRTGPCHPLGQKWRLFAHHREEHDKSTRTERRRHPAAQPRALRVLWDPPEDTTSDQARPADTDVPDRSHRTREGDEFEQAYGGHAFRSLR
jgi:hypothetical protein